MEDFKRLMPVFARLGVNLAGGCGEGKPVIDEKDVLFNGDQNCGHTEKYLGIAWPTDTATGISQTGDVIAGTWFAGAKIDQRMCDGDCSHETFHIAQHYKKPYPEKKPSEDGKEKGLWFDCCKTAYKPYDFAVICCLIIFKHHLKDEIIIKSDGELANWKDGMQICQNILGYGNDFTLEE